MGSAISMRAAHTASGSANQRLRGQLQVSDEGGLGCLHRHHGKLQVLSRGSTVYGVAVERPSVSIFLIVVGAVGVVGWKAGFETGGVRHCGGDSGTLIKTTPMGTLEGLAKSDGSAASAATAAAGISSVDRNST